MPIGSPAAPVDQVRVPPHNFEAEQSLLGAILLSNPAYEKVSEFLKPEHFADPVHGRIFAICGKLIERGQMANPVTLKAFFEQDGGLAEIGGTAYLAQLANSVVSVVNSGDYGRLVYDLHQRRELIGFGVDVVNDAYEVSIDTTAAQQISEAEGKLFQLATSGRSEGEPKTFNEFAVSALKQAEHLAGQIIGGSHRPDRFGQKARRPASLRPADHRRSARHGKNQYRHEHRVQRGEGLP